MEKKVYLKRKYRDRKCEVTKHRQRIKRINRIATVYTWIVLLIALAFAMMVVHSIANEFKYKKLARPILYDSNGKVIMMGH